MRWSTPLAATEELETRRTNLVPDGDQRVRAPSPPMDRVVSASRRWQARSPQCRSCGFGLPFIPPHNRSTNSPSHGNRRACGACLQTSTGILQVGRTELRWTALAGDNIRVNCVCPGNVLTPMTERVWRDEGRDPETVDKSGFQTPEEIADAVLFLASDAARQISGIALPVSGVHPW